MTDAAARGPHRLAALRSRAAASLSASGAIGAPQARRYSEV